MPKKFTDTDIASVLIAVGKICNSQAKKITYATPRSVARMCRFITTDGRADGKKAQSILRGLAKKGQIQAIGSVKLRGRESSGTKYAESYTTINHE